MPLMACPFGLRSVLEAESRDGYLDWERFAESYDLFWRPACPYRGSSHGAEDTQCNGYDGHRRVFLHEAEGSVAELDDFFAKSGFAWSDGFYR